MHSLTCFLLASSLLSSAPQAIFAELPAASDSIAAAVTSTQPRAKNDLNRWLELNTVSTSLRYRNTMNVEGVHMFAFGQHRELLDGRVKLDPAGRYSINFHGSSGRYFNWAYADAIGGQFTDTVPAGTAHLKPNELGAVIHAIITDPDGLTYAQGINSRGGYFYLRQLYGSATPIYAVTVEFGSLPIEHGVNTEITSFDDDGYIAGERVRIHDAKHLFFDEIDGTWAYLGDAFTPNFFSRGQRLGQWNYQQYLAKKKVGTRAVVSADFTELSGTHTMREAATVALPKEAVFDSARGEFYQRFNEVSLFGTPAPAGSGYSVSVMKNALHKRLQGEAGFASVDNNYAVYSGSSFLLSIQFSWNSDSFMNGKHPYARLGWKVGPGVMLNGFYTHRLDDGAYSVNGQSLNGGLTFDLADVLHRKHLVQ